MQILKCYINSWILVVQPWYLKFNKTARKDYVPVKFSKIVTKDYYHFSDSF